MLQDWLAALDRAMTKAFALEMDTVIPGVKAGVAMELLYYVNFWPRCGIVRAEDGIGEPGNWFQVSREYDAAGRFIARVWWLGTRRPGDKYASAKSLNIRPRTAYGKKVHR